MNKELITKAKSILERDLIRKTGKGYYEVDGEEVYIKTEDNVSRFSCTCQNCTINVNSQGLCHRKIAVIIFEAQDFRLKKLIRETEEQLMNCETLGVMIDHNVIKCLLNDLRRLV